MRPLEEFMHRVLSSVVRVAGFSLAVAVPFSHALAQANNNPTQAGVQVLAQQGDPGDFSSTPCSDTQTGATSTSIITAITSCSLSENNLASDGGGSVSFTAGGSSTVTPFLNVVSATSYNGTPAD